MQLLQLSLATPVENVALDEALLDQAEAAGQPSELLRLWEAGRAAVIVGRSSVLADEVNLAACRRAEVEIVRRSSGGAAVVVGPGCLVYSLVLSYELRPEARFIDRAHELVLGRLAEFLAPLAGRVACAGTSDLAIDECKFSGNSVRCKRSHFLYHGTVLYEMPLEWIGELLLQPPRQPAYRRGRGHKQFVRHFPAPRAALCAAIAAAWSADETARAWPQERVAELVRSKYGRPAWLAEGRVD